MRLITMQGEVPLTSPLPTWASVFPALISPEKIKLSDPFTDHADGQLAGLTVPYTTIGSKSWSTSNASVVIVSGHVEPGATGARLATIAVGQASMETCGRFRPADENGALGLVLRYTDAQNYLRAVLFPATNTIQIQQVVANVNTNLVTGSAVVTAGIDYDLNFSRNGSALSATVQPALGDATDAVTVTTTDASGLSGTAAGLYFITTATHQARSWVAGY